MFNKCVRTKKIMLPFATGRKNGNFITLLRNCEHLKQIEDSYIAIFRILFRSKVFYNYIKRLF